VGEFYLKPRVGKVLEGSAADKAGLKVGDVIIAIDGKPVGAQEEAVRTIHSNPHKMLKIDFERGNERFSRTILTQITVGGVPEDGPGRKVDVKPGSVVVSIEGNPLDKIKDPMAILKEKGLHKVGFRSGIEVEERNIETKAIEWFGSIGYISDMMALDVRFKKVGFLPMIANGVIELARYSSAPFKLIVYITQRRVDSKVLTESTAGPIGLGQMIAELFYKGIKPLIYFSAIINASLAIFNLIPFPALDGSRILILGISGLLRKPFDQEKEGIIHWVGFVTLILLVLIISYQDVTRIISGKGFFR
jgi:regulator of sigma E protease